jgi:sec-independent protein translocase protein TatA
MFGLGPFEMILILLAILIIFGAGRLPQVLGSLGKGVKEFREASEGTTSPPSTPTPQANGGSDTTQTPPTAKESASTPTETKS